MFVAFGLQIAAWTVLMRRGGKGLVALPPARLRLPPRPPPDHRLPARVCCALPTSGCINPHIDHSFDAWGGWTRGLASSLSSSSTSSSSGSSATCDHASKESWFCYVDIRRLQKPESITASMRAGGLVALPRHPPPPLRPPPLPRLFPPPTGCRHLADGT